MGVRTAKCRLPINSCYKFSFFPRYFYIKKRQLSIFFLFKGKRHVWMMSIKIITEFRKVFSRFEENTNVINISSSSTCHQHIYITILANGNNKFVLEIKESMLIKRDRPILNKNISSAKLFLFDNSSFFNRFFIQ